MTLVREIDINGIFKSVTGHDMPKEKQNVKPHPENTPPKRNRPDY